MATFTTIWRSSPSRHKHGILLCTAGLLLATSSFAAGGGSGTTGSGAPILPQGLTCGLSYGGCPSNTFWKAIALGAATAGVGGIVYAATNCTFAENHACNAVMGAVPGANNVTLRHAPGYTLVGDGDLGAAGGTGFLHQELQAGVTDPNQSTSFALPKGTACGFHHTLVSPGRTCMGQDPALGLCPKGWTTKRHFDMSSGNGYWAWCEYQDPKNLCADDACLTKAVWSGVACGLSSNTDSSGIGQCGGSPTQSKCPSSTGRTAYHDMGRSSGQGIAWCR